MTCLDRLLSEHDYVFFDGALGTMLQHAGIPAGQRPDVMNIVNPEAVAEVHRAYIAAGSNIINTNTFGANARALSHTPYSVREIIEAGVKIAKSAAGTNALVALDIGPIGEFIEPMGELTVDETFELFFEQVEIGAAAGADLVAIETMSDTAELTAAINAAKKACDLPILATMTFNADGRTFTGCTVSDFVAAAEAAGASALGLNCSLSPEVMLPTAREIAAATRLPIIIKPNAGLPNSDGEYDVTPESFANDMIPYRALGVKIVGACCGSDPDFIRALRNIYDN